MDGENVLSGKTVDGNGEVVYLAGQRILSDPSKKERI